MNFSIEKVIAIEVTSTQVWKTLVTPKLIKKYLYGNLLESDFRILKSLV